MAPQPSAAGLFVIARCDGMPIVWPEPTHGPGLEPYRTAAECLDWSLPCPSIFERSKPLAENTCRRIARGIVKYVMETNDPFIVTYYGEKRAGDFRGQSIHLPIATLTTENRHALILPHLSRQFGQSIGADCRKPAPDRNGRWPG